MVEEDEILYREFRHGQVAYGFQWNVSNHRRLGHETGDLASLYAHLETIHRNKVPERPFVDPLYTRASRLKLSMSSRKEKTYLRRKLEKSKSITTCPTDDIVEKVREYHRARNDTTYQADHAILKEFIKNDPATIAIEVPVWSDSYRLTGHVDLIRFIDGHIQVCDYKPGSLETVTRRFIDALPQVAAYGEMVTLHLSHTLRSALEAPLLPEVKCCIFDTHASWHFDAKLFVQLSVMGAISDI
ncbi:MAG: PD-(D/E)XK nuclease family protein [Candidatus Thorarchaeota archaeon]